jgi:hypothetical protein
MRILSPTSKKSRKILISTVLLLLKDLLSLKTVVNVPAVSNEKRTVKKIYFLLAFSKPLPKNRAASGFG